MRDHLYETETQQRGLTMAQAARAYAHSYPEREHAPARPARPRISVVPGQGTRTATETVARPAVFLAGTIAAVLVVLTLFGFARIWLSSAAVTTALSSQEISSELAAARSDGSFLEVQQSTLSNPTNVKAAATALGMAEPAETTIITLEQDIVATDAAGNLSFAESVRRAAGTSAQG